MFPPQSGRLSHSATIARQNKRLRRAARAQPIAARRAACRGPERQLQDLRGRSKWMSIQPSPLLKSAFLDEIHHFVMLGLGRRESEERETFAAAKGFRMQALRSRRDGSRPARLPASESRALRLRKWSTQTDVSTSTTVARGRMCAGNGPRSADFRRVPPMPRAFAPDEGLQARRARRGLFVQAGQVCEPSSSDSSSSVSVVFSSHASREIGRVSNREMAASESGLRSVNPWYNVYHDDLPIPDLLGRSALHAPSAEANAPSLRDARRCRCRPSGPSTPSPG